jgi:tetratricopeptide (TPR) repeat protein
MVKRNDNLFSEFEMALYEAAIRSNPNNEEALRALGYLYTKKRNHTKALTIDRKLCFLRPDDSVVHYNLACSLSNLGKIEDSLEALEMAILLGYSDVRHMEKDPDLDNIRNEPRYQEIVEKMKGKSKA